MSAAFVSATLLIVITGCRKPSTAQQATETSQYTAVDPATAGSVSGVVHFKGEAPAPIKIDMDQDPACALGSDRPNMTEQYVVRDDKLQNVYLYIKSGLGGRRYQPPAAVIVLDQQGCRYEPHVVAIMAGQQLEIRNNDSTMHNVHPEPDVPGNKAWDVSQAPKGKPVIETFDRPEVMMPVRCNNHPWMEAFLNIAPNPFFAVSDSAGAYSIHGLPPGTYTLAAVHEKLGEQDATITVTTGKEAQQDFSFGMK